MKQTLIPRVEADLEGPDHVGKATTVAAMMNLLLQENQPVIYSNYPSYWGFGQVIRWMNNGEVADFFRSHGVETTLRLRSAMFALDRALSLAMIVKAQQRLPNAHRISDRGSLSSSVTAGFIADDDEEAWNKFIGDRDEAVVLQELFANLDQERNTLLSPTPILLLANGNGSGHGATVERRFSDQLELPGAQKWAIHFYTKLIPDTQRIVTRSNGVWVDLTSTATQALSIAGYNVRPDAQLEPNQIGLFHQAMKEGTLIMAGPRLFIETFLPDLQISPRLEELIGAWELVTLMSDAEVARNHQLATKKDVLHEIELTLSKLLISCIATYQGKLGDVPPVTIHAVERLFRENPMLPGLITYVDLGEQIQAADVASGYPLPILTFLTKIVMRGKEI